MVNDVFKLEELSAAWLTLQAKVCGLRGVPYANAANSVRRNPSTHGHYSFYYDDETRKIMTDYMQADLDAFGYTFEQRME